MGGRVAGMRRVGGGVAGMRRVGGRVAGMRRHLALSPEMWATT